MASSGNTLIGSYGPSTTLSEQKEIRFIFNNFKSLGKETEFYETSLVECHGHKWFLMIYPWGGTEEARKKQMLTVYLYIKYLEKPTKIKFSIEIAGKNLTTDITFTKGKKSNWGWHQFMSRSEALEKLNENGALICNVTIQGWFQSTPEWYPENPILDKMRQLYNSEDESDVSFVFQDGNSVRANSHVLAIQCPSLYEIVHEAHDKKEVEIESADADLFGLMVRFMYHQDLPSNLFDLKVKGVELLKMADRFAYPMLKMRIEVDLVNSGILDVDNAAEFLVLADAHSCALLKEAAIQIVNENLTKAMKTKGWATLAESAALLNEVLQAKADNNSSGDEKVSTLRKRLARQDKDVDGTKEMLVKRLKKK